MSIRQRRGISKAAHRRLQRRLIVLGCGLACLALFLGGISYLAHLEWWRIQEVSVTGTDQVDEAQLRESVEEQLTGSYWWLFPRDNILLYPKTTIRRVLADTFPHIREFSVSADGPSALSVDIIERKPYAQWCPNVGTRQCYVLDSTGFVFSETEQELPEGQLIFRNHATTTATTSPGVGHQFDGIAKLTDLLEQLPPLGLHPVGFIRQTYDEYRIDLEDGRYLLVSTTNDIVRTRSNLKLILEHSDLNVSAQDPASFSYIDLRFGNRIFYKPSAGNTQSSSAHATTSVVY